MKQHLRLLVLSLSLVAIALPASASAGHKWGCKNKGGMMFNENDGMYYRVPGKSGMVYRGVDNKLIPVASYKHVTGVKCEPRDGYWWSTHWMAPSQQCYYIVR
jgi:hypothetical protein